MVLINGFNGKVSFTVIFQLHSYNETLIRNSSRLKIPARKKKEIDSKGFRNRRPRYF